MRPLDELIRFVEYFREVQPDIPVNHMALFMCIATNEGMSTVDLRRRVALTPATFSRALAKFGRSSYMDKGKRKKGLGLILIDYADADGSTRTVYLSDRGRQLFDKLCAAFA